MNKQASSAGYAEAVADFASELTRLRHKKNLTIEALANQSGVSRTSVTTALGGKELPSARNVIAIASACEVDEKPLVAQRDHIARMNDAPSSQPKKRQRGMVPWWWIPITAAVCALVASASTLVFVPMTRAPDSPQTVVPVATGQDPAFTRCLEDAKVVADQTTDKQYLLEIIYSDSCHAGWARLTRYDDAATGNTITVRIYRRESPAGTDAQIATEHDVQGAYTTLLVRPTSETLLCAEGSASLAGKEIVTQPLCT